jgi:hypothetical protein
LQSDDPGHVRPRKPVPVIDLAHGVPGLDEEYVQKWVEAEYAAFQGKMVRDDLAQLDVAEVAVSLRPYKADYRPLSLSPHHHF